MKKITVLLLTLVIGGMVSCSKSPADKEAEAKAIADEIVKSTQSTTEKLNKAANGKEAGDIIVEYATGMKKISEKYKDFDIKNDEKFKENDEIKQVMGEFLKAVTGAAMKFRESKEFMEAMQKMPN